jgi:hypothetical protein
MYTDKIAVPPGGGGTVPFGTNYRYSNLKKGDVAWLRRTIYAEACFTMKQVLFHLSLLQECHIDIVDRLRKISQLEAAFKIRGH